MSVFGFWMYEWLRCAERAIGVFPRRDILAVFVSGRYD